MKLTKCFLVASAAAMAGSLMSNVPNHKNNVFNASLLSPNVSSLMRYLEDRQGSTHLNNFANLYFSNLNNNIGVNAHGTCGFVSMGMLLSFYDTYLDDDFIPDSFEQNTFIERNGNNGTVIGRDTESPGVTTENYAAMMAMDKWDYEEYVVDNPNATFQNFLINYACDNIDQFTLDDDHNQVLGLTVANQCNLLNAYLSDYVGNEYSAYYVDVQGLHQSQHTAKNAVKQIIAKGEPVILNIASSIIGRHTVVAYDYDDENIYVHTGWKDANGHALSHVSLTQLNNNLYPGTQIESYVGIDITDIQPATDLDNYYTVDANNNVVPVSLKTLAVPFDFKMEYDVHTPEELPVFSWKSLTNEKWFGENYEVTFQIQIRDGETNNLICGDDYTEQSFTLKQQYLNQIIDENGMFEFKVVIKTIMPERVDGRRMFNQTTIISNKADYKRIAPVDYGFPIRHNDYAQDFVDVSASSGLDFKVRKTRNVVRSGDKIKFATTQNGATEAYVEYNFIQPITEIQLTVSQSEQLPGTATAEYQLTKGALFVQGFKNGQYFPDLSDKSQLERHQNNLLVGHEDEFRTGEATIKYEFSSPVFRVRIHTSAKLVAVGGGLTPRMKDRAVSYASFNVFLGDVLVKPVDGDYLPANGYEFHQGNTETLYGYNDYIYALSLDGEALDSDYEPGYFTSDEYWDYTDDEYCDIDVITAMAEADAAPGGLTGNGYVFEEIDKYDIADDGCYKIALAIVVDADNPNGFTDFRFFRQNSDGTWSYVAFDLAGRIRNWDVNGELIYDPSDVTFHEGNTTYTVRSENDIRFFQVSRDKGTLNAIEAEYYFPNELYQGNNPSHDYTWDEHYYIVQPPFKPIFTGEF